MAYENIILMDKGPIKIITINRPKVHNALNKRVLLELEKAFLEIEQNKNIKAAIITGAGDKSFVAGADLSEMKNFSALEAQNFVNIGHRVFDLISELRICVVAAVNGYALGGGLELALACDFIYASETASFGLVESRLSLIPGFGGCARLSQRIGLAYAKEMIFSAASINAHEALRIGLINRVVSEGDVLLAAEHICEKIAERGPLAICAAKKLLTESQNTSLKTANKMEQLAFGLIFSSVDHQEGINAFLEKRTPNYEGN